MKIDQEQEPDYECVTIEHIGFVDPYAVEGLVILRADDGRQFPMRAFSGEVARNITSFLDGDSDFPTIYRMFEDVCEHGEMFLVKVKIYESGQALRANLYLAGKNEMILRNYRASDALALAVYYNAPIMLRKSLFADAGV